MTATPIFDQLRREHRQQRMHDVRVNVERAADNMRRVALRLVPPLPPELEPHDVEARVQSDRASLDWHEQWRAER